MHAPHISSAPRLALFLLAAGAALSLAGHCGARQGWLHGEICRVRVENARFGRIEVSTDGGATYSLIGRVIHPAASTSNDRSAQTAGYVCRSNGHGVVFSVGPRTTITLRPTPPTSAAKSSSLSAQKATAPAWAVVTNIHADTALFGFLLPPVNASVRLQAGADRLIDFSEAYSPSDADRFVLVVPDSRTGAESEQANAGRIDAARGEVRERVAALAEQYKADALARAREGNLRVFSGTRMLRARLPAHEAEPIAAVTFMIDDDVVAARNVAPYEYAWDTTRYENGEHVVEICGLNSGGECVTSARALVVVKNDGAR